VQLQQKTAENSTSIMHHLMAITVPNFSRIAKANNSYSGLCEITPKHLSFRCLWTTLNPKTWNWCVLEWPRKSRSNYSLL